MAQKAFGRLKNDEKLNFFIQDSENTMQYSPNDYTGNKYFGSYSKLVNLQNDLFYEQNEKYINVLNAQRKAELELFTVPQCFNTCVSDVTTGLNSIEKNCMRECYFKKVSSRDDWMMYLKQRQGIEAVKESKERLV